MASKKVFQEVFFIILLSLLTGLGVNFTLVRKYIYGEFRQSFLVSDEYSSVTFITLPEAEELFLKGEAFFLDSRPEDLFQAGHILGALNIPFNSGAEKESMNFLSLPVEKTLVVYCDGSECQSSVELAKLLHQYGFKDIRIFFGGWREWAEAGYPVSSENDSE